MTKKNEECILTAEECDKLEDLRILLWAETFKIEKGAEVIENSINSIFKLIERQPTGESYGSEKVIGERYTQFLKELRNTADFLKSEQFFSERQLKDEEGDRYAKLGFYNNITHNIKDKCSCRM